MLKKKKLQNNNFLSKFKRINPLFISGFIFCLIILFNERNGFTQDNNIDQRVKALESYIETFQPNMVDFSNSVDTSMKAFAEDLQKNINDFSQSLQAGLEEKVNSIDHSRIVLNINSKEYQSIETSAGTLLVAVDHFENNAQGLKLYLNIGNPLYASFKGYTIRLYFGNSISQNSVDIEGQEYAFQGDLKRGAWNQAVLDIPQNQESNLSNIYMELSILYIELDNVEQTDQMP